MKVVNKVSLCLAGVVALQLVCIPVNAARKTQLTFMGWGQPSEIAIFSKVINKFKKANPDVDVKYTGIDPGQFNDKLTALIAAGKTPDVFYMPQNSFARWLKAGEILNLDSLLKSSRVDMKNVWDEGWDRWRYNGKQIGVGDIYAFPKDLGPFPMAYNGDILGKAGLRLPNPKAPLTWDEWLAMAKKTTLDINGDGRMEQFGSPGGMPFEMILWSFGGDFVNKDRDRVTLNTPEFIEAMQWYSDLTWKEHVVPQPKDRAAGWWDLWITGKGAFAQMGPWDQPTFWKFKFDWDIAPWPMDAKIRKSQGWVGSMGLCVGKESKHQKEAFEFASYLALDPDAQRALYQLGQSVPNLKDMAYDDFLKMKQGPKSRFVFLDVITKYGRPGAEWGWMDQKWLDAFWSGAGSVWNGKMTAANFLRTNQDRIQKLFEVGGNAR